jgi:threonylcarbamoyladenosine tRNA methylthiotransferase MtaB
LDNELHKAYCQSLVGNTYEVLWEMRNKEGFWEGLTPNYVRTFCQSSENLTGKILPIKIEKTFLDGVLGDIIQFTRQGGENND